MSRTQRPSTVGPPGFPTMAGRALRRRCPRCGGKRAWFTGWFAHEDRCLSCGYKYARQDGFELGSTTMNIVVTFGLFGLGLLITTIATYPDLPVVPMLAVGFTIALAVPIAFFPISQTLWAAVDLRMRPLEPAEEADAITAHAARVAARAERSE